MRLELPTEDMAFLRTQLMRRLADLEDELAHTERHQLQHELASDVKHVRELAHAIARALSEIDVVV